MGAAADNVIKHKKRNSISSNIISRPFSSSKSSDESKNESNNINYKSRKNINSNITNYSPIPINKYNKYNNSTYKINNYINQNNNNFNQKKHIYKSKSIDYEQNKVYNNFNNNQKKKNGFNNYQNKSVQKKNTYYNQEIHYNLNTMIVVDSNSNYMNYIKKKINIDNYLMKFEDISRNPIYINLLHYDDNLTNNENQNYYKYFKLNIVGGYYGIDNFDMFIEYIKEINNTINFLRYFLIVSGSNSNKVLQYCYNSNILMKLLFFALHQIFINIYYHIQIKSLILVIKYQQHL